MMCCACTSALGGYGGVGCLFICGGGELIPKVFYNVLQLVAADNRDHSGGVVPVVLEADAEVDGVEGVGDDVADAAGIVRFALVGEHPVPVASHGIIAINCTYHFTFKRSDEYKVDEEAIGGGVVRDAKDRLGERPHVPGFRVPCNEHNLRLRDDNASHIVGIIVHAIRFYFGCPCWRTGRNVYHG